MEFDAGFGVPDQGFSSDAINNAGNLVSNIDPSFAGSCSNFTSSTPNILHTTSLPYGFFAQQQQFQFLEALDEKPQNFNPRVIMNQNQAMCMPLSFAQFQEHHLLSSSPPKRLNYGSSGLDYQFPKVPTKIGMAATAKPKIFSTDEMTNQQLQQTIIDQLIQAAELIETWNPVLAQVILARLNHQLSPVGKPFVRAAFYFKEALELLMGLNTSANTMALSSYNMILKVGAYKSFTQISPIVRFANFTCNQALFEVFQGCSRIHIIDFDIGYGGQWASLMQELVLRNDGAPSLKITVIASPSTHDDEQELNFTQVNLKHFASEINIDFEIEIIRLESLNYGSWPLPQNEAIAVNLSIGSFSSYPSTFPLVLRFVKQLSPKIVVCLERGCHRTDVSFPHHIIYALQSYTCILESLDATNMNVDALQKIEKLLIQPDIEKLVSRRHRFPERTPPWRTLFEQYGFSPLSFSNFTESQAECLVNRTPVKGLHVEKRKSTLVLCWQRRDLIAASAWRC